jgi:hypothetical protein
MNKEQEEFLRENFKAGEYYNFSMMIQENQFDGFVKVLNSFQLTLAIIPLNKINGYQSLNIFVKKNDYNNFADKMKTYLKVDISKKISKQ